MSTYSFIVRKGNFKLELTTTDSEMLAKQFELWVADAGAYAKQIRAKECKNLVESQIKAEEKITQKNIDAQITKKELNKDFKVMPEESKGNVLEHPESSNENNKKDDLDIFYAPPKSEANSTIADITKSAGVFDNILENSMNSSKTELSFKASPSIQKDNAFLNYISSRKIEKKIDYLLLTAYYFTQYEQKPRFTLKQLNAKLMQNIAVIIDHSILQEAINRDYIECLPDLTGLVGSSEYRLTAYGEKVLLDD